MSELKKIVLPTALALLILMPASLAATPAGGPAADTGLQAEIRATVRGLNEAHGEEERQAALASAGDLRQRDQADRIRLLEQVALFLAGSTSTEEAMGGAVLFHALKFQHDEILAATLPHLLASPPELNKILRELAATTVAPEAGADDPVTAILAIEEWRTEATGDPPTTGRRDEIGGLLDDLAGNDNRWVRTYTAAMVALDPELVEPAVRERLQKDQ